MEQEKVIEMKEETGDVVKTTPTPTASAKKSTSQKATTKKNASSKNSAKKSSAKKSVSKSSQSAGAAKKPAKTSSTKKTERSEIQTVPESVVKEMKGKDKVFSPLPTDEGLSVDENALKHAEKLFKKQRNIKEKPVEVKKKKRHRELKPEQVERFFPALEKGLTDEQVELREEQGLVNSTTKKYSKSYWSIIAGNVFTFFNLLGILVTIALIIVKAPIAQFSYVFVYLANIAIGIIQEIRAKHSVEKLSLISAKSSVVIRNGYPQEIPSVDIVLDDLVTFRLGNQIATDCCIVSGEVEVNESLLTGESVAVKKGVGDFLYAGSFISSGNCVARAENVGKHNYVEKLSAKAKKYKKPNSEIMHSLSVLITTIGAIIIPLAALNFIKTNLLMGLPMADAVTSTSGLIIGMIPSGMFLLTSMTLAVGVIRLANKNTLVQDLYSLEMLARVDVLCLDKTGTITDGRMKVNDCILLNAMSTYTISEIMGSMLQALNDSNQTAAALYNHFGFSSVLKPDKILPFNSAKKYSAVTFKDAGTYVFGAPEFVLKEMPEKLNNLIRQYASMGLRVILLANAKGAISPQDELPAQLKPVALITITDCIRENVTSTIDWFKNNDVAIKVISGDNPLTVSEIARKVGIPNSDKYISLEGMSERDVIAVANSYTVFGRVTPEQKAILVKAMKFAGHNVAMTGDGVNDILAMREADCAISFSAGSDAARNISHLVLLDNNFNSMPQIVHEGRRVINNVQNSASLFLMKTLFTMLISIIWLAFPKEWGGYYPFVTVNMIILEIFVIGVPSFFLSLQANDKRVEGKFINYVLSKAIPCALLMVLSCVIVFFSKILLAGVDTFPNPDEVYLTMMVLTFTFAGTIMLFRICQPFNFYRGLLYTICFICVVVWSVYAIVEGSIIGLVPLFPLDEFWHHLLIVLAIELLIVPISSGLDKLGNTLRKPKVKDKE